MRKIALASLFIIACAGVAAGDTAMLHVVEKGYIPTEENGALLYASALEAGIMDSLFESGHIAFSSGMDAQPGSAVIRRTAEAGGAGLLVEVELICRNVPGERNLVPREVVYSLTSTRSGETVTRGKIAAFTGSGGEQLEGESLCFDLGLRVADRIIALF